MKSSDPALVKRVEENYEAPYGLEQGGIAYLKIDIYDMFNMHDDVINSIQELFKNLAWYGVSNYSSENVALLFHKINAMAERLSEVPALPKGYAAANPY